MSLFASRLVLQSGVMFHEGDQIAIIGRFYYLQYARAQSSYTLPSYNSLQHPTKLITANSIETKIIKRPDNRRYRYNALL